jgi:hypothetical protein
LGYELLQQASPPFDAQCPVSPVSQNRQVLAAAQYLSVAQSPLLPMHPQHCEVGESEGSQNLGDALSQHANESFEAQWGVSYPKQSVQLSPQTMSVGWLQHSGCPPAEQCGVAPPLQLVQLSPQTMSVGWLQHSGCPPAEQWGVWSVAQSVQLSPQTMSPEWLQHRGCPLAEQWGVAPDVQAVHSAPHCTWPAASQQGAQSLNTLPVESHVCVP